jgi:DNA segregation ATPase FtsK/SpoIIIE, S-DNA-T family
MATKRKKKTTQEKPEIFAVSPEQRKKLLGILISVFSILIFISVLSYSGFDKANLKSELTDVSNSKDIHNAIGVLGAYMSDFLINSTIGYFSIVIPVIIFIWGFSLLKKFTFKTLIVTSNFLLLSAILLASFFGILRLRLNLFTADSALSGAAGDFLGKIISSLLGPFGGLVFLCTAGLAIMILVFDVKPEKIYEYLKRLFFWFKGLFDREEIGEAGEKTKSLFSDNLEKIKNLRNEKKKKRSLKQSIAALEEEEKNETKDDTKIRIIRKGSEEAPKPDKNDIPKIIPLKKPEPNPDGETVVSEPTAKESEMNAPDQWEEKITYKKPSLDLLEPVVQEDFKVAEEELKRNAELLKEKLKLFDIEIKDISVTPGPVVTLYEIVPAPGVKISKIVGLENDIALALAARGIRIIAPIPGKSAIGVEIPNAQAALVNARSVLSKISERKEELPLALGKDIVGDVYYTDLAKMPHLLIAGSTGSGKSVGVNMIITSILYSKNPDEVKFSIIDPKKIELSFYNKLRKHYLAVSPDLDEEIITNPQNAVILLKSIEYEMEKRYDKLAKAGVRNIVDYNIKVKDPVKKPKDTEKMKHFHLPYIILIIDELADLMITAGKEIEEPIARLAQLARAVGIHLVLATQRPSVNVITGVIKANFPARLAYQVATKIDSRTILDMNGAEQLLGRGDMLFLPSGTPKPFRIQNAFISTEEVEKVTDYVSRQPSFSRPFFLPSLYEKKKDALGGGFLADKDPLFEDAARVIVRHQQGSVSLLQRRLKLGYSRAARIVDQLEEAGIVGPNDGSKAREVIVENEEQLETILRNI